MNSGMPGWKLALISLSPFLVMAPFYVAFYVSDLWWGGFVTGPLTGAVAWRFTPALARRARQRP